MIRFFWFFLPEFYKKFDQNWWFFCGYFQIFRPQNLKNRKPVPGFWGWKTWPVKMEKPRLHIGRFFFYAFFHFQCTMFVELRIICSVYGHCTPNRRIVSTSPSLIPFFISHIFDQNENGITSTDKYGAMSLMPDNFFFMAKVYIYPLLLWCLVYQERSEIFSNQSTH